MGDYLRTRLQKRAENSNKVKPSPSERHSEAMRKKFATRAGIKLKNPAPGGVDCWTCPLQPCDKTPDTCMERTMIHCCTKCGQKVRHYVAPGNPWLLCPRCREETK